jgi:Thiamine pyrophosphate-requiring enzymes [acetolactate synthase, pyruvate dehydrogenase (cytochrome), glyoxylate carboligase, phosphonopyruvate decarboxylase]
MKLSDYVIDFLARRGVTRVFGMSGGAAVHLFDSADRHPDLHYVCSQHEQSAALSADGYARVSGRMGVAITTSGPGATNLLTGTCCSYFDSVPTLMITGQVATHRLKGDRDIRQMGFQETDVTSIFAPVTKYAAQVRDPLHIRRHLEEAWYWAFEGRPGSVLIDLPDDLQREDVDPDALEGFTPPSSPSAADLEAQLVRLDEMVATARRPLLVLGGGLSTPRIGVVLDELIDRLGFPVALTWAAVDLVAADHPLRVGPFGVYGPRAGNFAVQNADLLVCLGTRLSQNVTGGMLATFAREARIVMVDAAKGELSKFQGRGIDVALPIQARLDAMVPAWLARLDPPTQRPDLADWRRQIAHWRQALPDDRPPPAPAAAGYVDAYDFVDRLSTVLPEGEPIFVDTGGNLTWTCNGLRIKRGQRLMSAWNNTPMGYALPAAIGAAVAPGVDQVTCIIGDGGLMICLAELATLVHRQLPIKVLVFNNHGHGIQKQTLETWLNGHYVGVDGPSGLAFPPIGAVAKAIGLPVIDIAASDRIEAALHEAYAMPGPVLCNVEINPAQKLYPVVKFGASLEDQIPLLDPDVIAGEMLVTPVQRGGAASTGTPGV